MRTLGNQNGAIFLRQRAKRWGGWERAFDPGLNLIPFERRQGCSQPSGLFSECYQGVLESVGGQHPQDPV